LRRLFDNGGDGNQYDFGIDPYLNWIDWFSD